MTISQTLTERHAHELSAIKNEHQAFGVINDTFTPLYQESIDRTSLLTFGTFHPITRIESKKERGTRRAEAQQTPAIPFIVELVPHKELFEPPLSQTQLYQLVEGQKDDKLSVQWGIIHVKGYPVITSLVALVPVVDHNGQCARFQMVIVDPNEGNGNEPEALFTRGSQIQTERYRYTVINMDPISKTPSRSHVNQQISDDLARGDSRHYLVCNTDYTNVSPTYRNKAMQAKYEEALREFAVTLRLSKDF